jgi:hypothetical protein
MQQKSAREILGEIKRESRSIEQKKEQIQSLHDKMTSISSQPDKVSVRGGGVSDKIGQLSVECVALEEELRCQILKMELKKNRIIKLINGLEKEEYAELLYRVYVKQEKVFLAADAMGYSEDWGKHAHRKAIEAFEKKYCEK